MVSYESSADRSSTLRSLRHVHNGIFTSRRWHRLLSYAAEASTRDYHRRSNDWVRSWMVLLDGFSRWRSLPFCRTDCVSDRLDLATQILNDSWGLLRHAIRSSRDTGRVSRCQIQEEKQQGRTWRARQSWLQNSKVKSWDEAHREWIFFQSFVFVFQTLVIKNSRANHERHQSHGHRESRISARQCAKVALALSLQTKSGADNATNNFTRLNVNDCIGGEHKRSSGHSK